MSGPFYLEAHSPTGEMRRIDVYEGAPRHIGSGATCDERFTDDPWLAPSHLAVWTDGVAVYVRDLDTPHGVYINGQGAREGTLHEGGSIQAGSLFLVVRRVGNVAVSDALDVSAHTRSAAVRLLLERETRPLYVIVDAARDARVLPWVKEQGSNAMCLYDGWRGEELSDVAPYLVATPYGSRAFDTLIEMAWGESWGVFLASHAEARELRRHLRRFLRVMVKGHGRMLFRFYDPRVLGAWLPTCTTEEAKTFFGPIEHFVAEGHSGESLTRFAATTHGVSAETLSLPDEVQPS